MTENVEQRQRAVTEKREEGNGERERRHPVRDIGRPLTRELELAMNRGASCLLPSAMRELGLYYAHACDVHTHTHTQAHTQ